jgi:hypothetical protein
LSSTPATSGTIHLEAKYPSLRSSPKSLYVLPSPSFTSADPVPPQSRFGITLNPETLAFVPLKKRYLVHDATWKRFTLVGQSLGSVVLAYEGLRGEKGVVPDVWIGASSACFLSSSSLPSLER